MPRNNVQFYGSMANALGGDTIRQDYRDDPRYRAALRPVSTAPVQSNMEGILRALQGGVTGYFGGQAKREMQAKEAAQASEMQRIMQAFGPAGAPQASAGPIYANQQDARDAYANQTAQAESEASGLTPQQFAKWQGQGAALPAQPTPLTPDQISAPRGMAGVNAAVPNPETRGGQNLKMQLALMGMDEQRNGPTGRPSSSIQEYEKYEEIVKEFGADSPEARLFLRFSDTIKVVNVGDKQIVLGGGGKPIATFAKGIPPEQTPKNKAAVKRAEVVAGVVGKEEGDTKALLAAADAAMPRLTKAVEELKELGKTATYSLVGQAVDFASKELGFGATSGSVARAEYVAHVKNIVLPLLRQTFGAAFTAAEGDSLLATLGDPDMHPDEKSAVLDAFISDKKADLEKMRRQVGKSTFDSMTLDELNAAVKTPPPASVDARVDALLKKYAPR